MDSYAVHAGVQGVITRFLVRALGGAIDTNAIPDRTVRRENQDASRAPSLSASACTSGRSSSTAPSKLLDPDFGDASSRRRCRRAAPENETGLYKAVIMSAELSAQIRF